jgi:two-component system phosphate regulon response regulator PhoB
MDAKVLVLETDETLALVISYTLRSEGLTVEAVAAAGEAARLIASKTFDLAILGTLPPETAPEIRDEVVAAACAGRVPVLIVDSASGEPAWRDPMLRAVERMARPFSMLDFVTRVITLLRRSASTLAVHGLLLDREAHYVARHGRELRLGPTEYRLLEFMMEHPGRVFTRAELRARIWGEGVDVAERTIDVHIGRLRKALNRGREPDPIRTVRGAGYSLAPQQMLRSSRRGRVSESSH